MAAKLIVGQERERVTLTAETSSGLVGTFRLTPEAADALGRRLISNAQVIEAKRPGGLEKLAQKFAGLWT